MTTSELPRVHPSAVVEDGATVGAGTRLWHSCHVREGSVIGHDCTFGFCVYVDTGVVVGDRCKVQNHVSLYRGVVLEDEVFVGPSATFTNDLLPRAQSPGWQVSPTIVRHGASIGANATVVCGTEIGAWAMVAAGTVVTADVPPHALVVGVPGRVRGWVCRCGRVVAHNDEPPPLPVHRLRGGLDRQHVHMIPVSALSIGELETLVLEVLRSGRLVRGPMVDRFEAAVAEATGSRHTVAVNNGTSALIAASLAHGIGPGDEVITSPFTFVATLNAVLHVGATPRFADIGDDFNLDPDSVARAVTPRTRALLPVHLYGCPAPMDALAGLAARHGLVVVEDGAQALGGRVDGRPVGRFGTACFSFYATKNVTTGEGGAVTTDDDRIVDGLRVLRDQGQRGPYDYERPGFNLRMTELEAAVGVAQMSRLDELLDARRRNARRLREGLSDIRGLVVPYEPLGRRHVFHQFTVRVTDDAPCTRAELSAALLELGVESRVFYPRPVYDYECFRADPRVGAPCTPAATRAGREVLSLPVHPALDEGDLDQIVTGVRKVLT